MANPNCEAYYHESSNCYEAAASGLVGALPDSPTAKVVFLDTSINRGTVCPKVYIYNVLKHSLVDLEQLLG